MRFIVILLVAMVLFGAVTIASFLTVWTLIVACVIGVMLYVYSVYLEYKQRKQWRE